LDGLQLKNALRAKLPHLWTLNEQLALPSRKHDPHEEIKVQLPLRVILVVDRRRAEPLDHRRFVASATNCHTGHLKCDREPLIHALLTSPRNQTGSRSDTSGTLAYLSKVTSIGAKLAST
jgi:hypothetical protein